VDYDILARIIELTDSPEDLDKRLDGVASVLAQAFSFDNCSIYLWDRDGEVFNLAAVAGDETNCVKTYRKGIGFPERAIKRGGILVAHISRKAKAGALSVEKEIADEGLRGFSTVVISPIRDETTLYGLLYLKNKGKKVISARRKKMLEVITLQIATAIKTSQCVLNLMEVNTQLRDMQARLVHAEKLLALGEMASTLVHEIKTPLVSIGGFARRLCQHLPSDTIQRVYGDRILNEVERLEKLLSGMVDFSMDKGLELTLVDINTLMDESLQLFQEELEGSSIKVVKEFFSPLPPIEVDQYQMKLVFNNLITNAIQAMKGGGVLTVKTRQEGKWTVVEMSDTGGGISPDIVGNIFNPFFTTKEGGTGLGLAITHTIVRNHNGVIEVINNLGVGVTFLVKIPGAMTRIGI